MKKILELASKLETFQNQGISEVITKTFKDNEGVFLEFITEDQLYEKGIDRNGQALANSEPYSPVTISIKLQKGQPTNRVTTRDTEDFHNSFYIEYGSEKLEVKASDWKMSSLVEKYGPIIGWTDENLQDILRYYLLPELIKAVPI